VPPTLARGPRDHPPGTLPSQAAAGLIFYALLALTVWVYWPGLSGPLLLDDVENLRPLDDLGQGLMSWRDLVLTNASGTLGRYVSMASFAANYLTSGGDVWSLKYTNLMVHLLCGTLVFWLGGRLFAQARLRAAWAFALAAAALWLFAPILVSTVLYVVQRMAQLATLFVLAGLLSYVAGRQAVALHRVRGSALILSAFLLWMPLAAFSKENGVLLPLLTLVIEAFFFQFRGDRYSRGLLAAIFTVFLAVPGALALLKLALDPGFVTAGYAARNFTFQERVLTEPRVLFTYISALVFPYGPALGLYHDDYSVSTGLFSPLTTAVAITAWLTALVVPWLTKSSIARFLGFGLTFFLAGQALESTIFPLEL
jgi:protein O-mannosyl-transferase